MEVTAADWDDVVAIDGRGMFLTSRSRRWCPPVVAPSFVLDLRTGRPEAAGSARPAKVVATGLTKQPGGEWADRAIMINAVGPGSIRTERVKYLPQEPGGSEYLAATE